MELLLLQSPCCHAGSYLARVAIPLIMSQCCRRTIPVRRFHLPISDFIFYCIRDGDGSAMIMHVSMPPCRRNLHYWEDRKATPLTVRPFRKLHIAMLTRNLPRLCDPRNIRIYRQLSPHACIHQALLCIHGEVSSGLTTLQATRIMQCE